MLTPGFLFLLPFSSLNSSYRFIFLCVDTCPSRQFMPELWDAAMNCTVIKLSASHLCLSGYLSVCLWFVVACIFLCFGFSLQPIQYIAFPSLASVRIWGKNALVVCTSGSRTVLIPKCVCVALLELRLLELLFGPQHRRQIFFKQII